MQIIYKLSTLISCSCCCLFLVLGGCAEYDIVPDTVDFSEEILEIISEEQIDSLESLGLRIHRGFNPPELDGIYLVSPYTLVVPYGAQDPWDVGRVIDDYKYRFYNFNGRNGSVSIDFKALSGVSSGTGQGGFVSGRGNSFTIFSTDQATGNDGSTSTMAAIYSGTIVANGIRNFQYAFLLTAKNDPNNALIPVNTGRIFDDGDGLAEVSSVFRLGTSSSDIPSDARSTLSRQ